MAASLFPGPEADIRASCAAWRYCSAAARVVEDPPVEQFIPQRAVEGRAEAVFPRRTWRDAERLHPDRGEPLPDLLRDEFRTIPTVYEWAALSLGLTN